MDPGETFDKIKHQFWSFSEPFRIVGCVLDYENFYMKPKVNAIPQGDTLEVFSRNQIRPKHLPSLSTAEHGSERSGLGNKMEN